MEGLIAVIFSKDRALQLDGVLRSLFLHCKDPLPMKINVLYHATNERHLGQYQTLIEEYSGKVVFRRQASFRSDLMSILEPYPAGTISAYIFLALSWLGGFGIPADTLPGKIWRRIIRKVQLFLITNLAPAIPADRFVLFLVDDNIFVRDFSIGDAIDMLKRQNDIVGFSMRLGENTTYSYSQNRTQMLPDFVLSYNGLVKFNWTTSDGDFGYPLEISSSIYRLKNLLPFIAGLRFSSPNVLESEMAFHADMFQYDYPFLGSYRYSVTFCNPLNMVQNEIPNRAGENIQYSVEKLSHHFEQGERIWVERYSGFVPQACHQEVELTLLKVGDSEHA